MPYSQVVERSFFTRKKVYDALVELLAVRPYRDIGVDSLCGAAQVSRATFYRHFGGKDGVVGRHFKDLSQDTLDLIGKTLSWRQGNLLMTENLLEFKDLYTKVVGNPELGMLASVGQEVHEEGFLAVVRERCPEALDEELLFEIEACSRIVPIMMSKWISGGMVEPPSEMADRLKIVAPMRLREIVDSLAEGGVGGARR